MPLLLNVPYPEKDIAKSLGAFWNPSLKKWYVNNSKDYHKFLKWLPADTEYIVCDYLYVIAAKRTCYKCKQETWVISFAFENYYEFGNAEDLGGEFIYEENTIHMVSQISPIPSAIFDIISTSFNYGKKYSKTIHSTYYANSCEYCGALQGNYYLFSDTSSPFFICSKKDAANLSLLQFPLKYDLVLSSADIIYSSTDYLIKQYAQIRTFDQLI